MLSLFDVQLCIPIHFHKNIYPEAARYRIQLIVRKKELHYSYQNY